MMEGKGISCLLSLAVATGAALAPLAARWVNGGPITGLDLVVAGLAFVVAFLVTETVQRRFFAYPAHAWRMSAGFNLSIDFCVWILEVDGLHVPPFTHHPRYVGQLQTIGLTAATWYGWLERVVALQVDCDRQASARRGTDALFELMGSHPAYTPARAWPGDLHIREQLTEQWDRYLEVSNRRREREQPLLIPDGPKLQPTLWEALEPYRTRLEMLKVYLVGYPVAVEHSVPPVSLLIAIGGQEFDQAALRAKILRGAAGLAAQTVRYGAS